MFVPNKAPLKTGYNCWISMGRRFTARWHKLVPVGPFWYQSALFGHLGTVSDCRFKDDAGFADTGSGTADSRKHSFLKGHPEAAEPRWLHYRTVHDGQVVLRQRDVGAEYALCMPQHLTKPVDEEKLSLSFAKSRTAAATPYCPTARTCRATPSSERVWPPSRCWRGWSHCASLFQRTCCRGVEDRQEVGRPLVSCITRQLPARAAGRPSLARLAQLGPSVGPLGSSRHRHDDLLDENHK